MITCFDRHTLIQASSSIKERISVHKPLRGLDVRLLVYIDGTKLTLSFFFAVVNATGCTGAANGVLSCLRGVSYGAYYNATVSSGYNPAVVPDGDFLQDYIPNLIRDGKFVKRCAVFGANLDEGTSKSPSNL